MSFRSGFLARGFLSLGPLVVSFGYGSTNNTPIPAPPPPLEVLLEAATAPEGQAATPVVPRVVSGRQRRPERSERKPAKKRSKKRREPNEG
jgi:hypothetical protein